MIKKEDITDELMARLTSARDAYARALMAKEDYERKLLAEAGASGHNHVTEALCNSIRAEAQSAREHKAEIDEMLDAVVKSSDDDSRTEASHIDHVAYFTRNNQEEGKPSVTYLAPAGTPMVKFAKTVQAHSISGWESVNGIKMHTYRKSGNADDAKLLGRHPGCMVIVVGDGERARVVMTVDLRTGAATDIVPWSERFA
jgi:hypothetical protein